jgi:hypothetical protein
MANPFVMAVIQAFRKKPPEPTPPAKPKAAAPEDAPPKPEPRK